MKIFRGRQAEYKIVGNDTDAYYNLLPEHDLSALSNYFFRCSAKRSFNSIFDIGANIGLSTILMSEMCPNASVYSFEPVQETYNNLAKNLSNNMPSASITSIQSAVGESTGFISFSQDLSNSSANHITNDSSGTVVASVTLDDFVDSQGIDGVDFIKIDVEGYEGSVIAGAKKTIFRFRPVVFFEYNEYAIRVVAGQDPVKVLGNIMLSLGQIGIVNPLSGEATALPTQPQLAYDKIKSISKSDFDVFDLATHYF